MIIFHLSLLGKVILIAVVIAVFIMVYMNVKSEIKKAFAFDEPNKEKLPLANPLDMSDDEEESIVIAAAISYYKKVKNK